MSDAEGDPDQPSEGFCSIDQAVNALREGKVGENHIVVLHAFAVRCFAPIMKFSFRKLMILDLIET